MMLSLKKNGDGSEGPKEDKIDKRKIAHTADANSVAGFIPYYCHFNPHTILTKNGELMQIIKIVTNLRGLEYESGSDPSSIVREAIRDAVLDHVNTDRVAIWFHTIRKRKSIRYRGKFKEPFATSVHDRWQQINRWKYQYYNEIYISIIFDGQPAPMVDTKNFKYTFLPKLNRQFRNAYLDGAYKELDRLTSRVISSVQRSFNAQRLSVVERVPPPSELPVNQTVFYSEPMEFLGSLLNLRYETYLLPELDLSEALSTTSQTFGFNALETKGPDGKRRFGAILTLKQYREVPSETIDRLLQAPMEFIVTQTFHFIPANGALVQYKEQKQVLDISGDLYCIQASGIEDMMSSQSGRATDFGEGQTSIMVLADEYKQLDAEISKVQTAFAELGLITIREDIKLEECFWSQLPANFEFIRRRDTINTTRVGGFCRLNRYPQGIATNNHWGDAVTILPTLVGSPYFFNFHHQDNGHTVLFDFNSFNDTICPVLMNFMMTETRKFGGNLFIFDLHRSADLFFQKLGGQYYNFPTLTRSADQPPAKLNPFLLEDTPRNRSFLLAWCGLLTAPDPQLSDAQKETLKAAIDQLYSGPPEKRNLPGFAAAVAAKDVPLAKMFAKWHGEGGLRGMFDAAEDEFNARDGMHAFDMSPIVQNKDCLLPVFSYLLHRIVTEIDGRPSIILMYEAWNLFNNDFMAPRLESLMEMLQQNNVMMVFTTTKPSNCIHTPIFNVIMKNCATHLFLPDDIGHFYNIPEFDLDEIMSKRLNKMDRQKGDFMMRQNNEYISLRANVKELDDIHAVFNNDIKTLAAALGKYSATKKEKK